MGPAIQLAGDRCEEPLSLKLMTAIHSSRLRFQLNTPAMPDEEPNLPGAKQLPIFVELPSEELTPMLDVHPAHHAASTWREFFIHIATIVLGLLIAVGLEQGVESLHRRHQLHQAEEALQEEGVINRSIADGGLARIDAARRVIHTNMARLDQDDPTHSSTMPALLPYAGYTRIFMVSDAAWLSLSDSGLLPLISPEVAHRYWKLDYTHRLIVNDNDNIMRQREIVESLMNPHQDPTRASDADRAALYQAFSRLDQALVQMRGSLAIFRIVNDMALSGQTLDEKKFDELTK